MAYRIHKSDTEKSFSGFIVLTAQYRKHWWGKWEDIGAPTGFKREAEADIERHRKRYNPKKYKQD